MKIISPFMEQLSGRAVQLVEGLRRPVPAEVKAFMQADGALPGLTQDPVLIIAGLTADGYMYTPAVRALQADGFSVRAMRMPRHGWNGIPEDAAHVRSEIQGLLAEARAQGRDVTRVQLVGDSEGGLIARWFLQNDPEALDLVSNLVTNGTPHNGVMAFGSERLSSMSQTRLLPKGVRDLISGSPVMRSLNQGRDGWLELAAQRDPNFRVHVVMSYIPGTMTDSLVSNRAGWMPGEAPQVMHYWMPGLHSANFAGAKTDTANWKVLSRVLGSTEPVHVRAAEIAVAKAQTMAGEELVGVVPGVRAARQPAAIPT